jgi:hypothetical protein
MNSPPRLSAEGCQRQHSCGIWFGKDSNEKRKILSIVLLAWETANP